MPGRKTTTWILVADGARARVLENTGPGKGLISVSEQDNPDSRRPTRDLGADRKGRTNEAGTRHAVEPRVDWHRFEKRLFAKSVAKLLDQADNRRDFDALILVAPPATLGDLRRALGGQTRAKVKCEINKDLTNLSIHELPGHLDQVIRL